MQIVPDQRTNKHPHALLCPGWKKTVLGTQHFSYMEGKSFAFLHILGQSEVETKSLGEEST